ncbi:MAG: dihydroorotase [Gammaproteobacteria bacterium RBG_16_57_12]|nr:MAG: dihydroorotase [Gammaproteobacteria bacterium RBG_16_57_12]
MRIAIRGGRLIIPDQGIDAVQDLYIAAGKVVGIGTSPDGFIPDRVIDAHGLIVCPGLVDLRARLREPGQEHKATIASETRAAAAGGITTLCCPPDTDPVIDTPAVAELIKRRAAQVRKARVMPLGALTRGLKGVQLSEMKSLKEAGCVGLSNALRAVENAMVMRRAMEYAATLDMTVFLHAQDAWLGKNGCVHEGELSTRLGLTGIPASAETMAVARDLQLIEQTGVRAHFCQLSTAQAVQMISRAQYDGLDITVDVTAHHLHLTHIDVGDFNSQCHVLPPLRTERDRQALIGGLQRGIITAICSDHQPHDLDAKLAPFAETEPGISALETLLPLALRLVEQNLLSLQETLASLTCNPAEILGLAAGTLTPGGVADLCIFDPNRYWSMREHDLLSAGKNSPFLGWDLRGRVTHTLLGGDLVFELEPEET